MQRVLKRGHRQFGLQQDAVDREIHRLAGQITVVIG
jgi:hypothetical protein